MSKEKEIADKIFDLFRAAKCKVGQGVMIRNIEFAIYHKLNPKEQEIFHKVFVGLQLLGYYSCERRDVHMALLTQMGYDSIYDDEKMAHFKEMPWILPSTESPDWSISYNLLWRAIGENGKCPAYITGPKFYSISARVDATLPPSYKQFYENRRDKGLSLSRVDFFKDILDTMSDENRMQVYVELQEYIDDISNSPAKKDQMYEIDSSPTELPFDNPFADSLTAESSNQDKRIVYVSYSWAHSTEMDEICECLDLNGIKYKRDKKDCKYRDSIKQFEAEIGKGNIVIAVIHEKYLKSIHCMYELTSLVEHGYIEERLFPVIYIEQRDAFGLANYYQYWTDEFEKRREHVSTQPAGTLRLMIEELGYCDAIISALPIFWQYITNYNTSTPELLKENGYKELIDSIKKKLG